MSILLLENLSTFRDKECLDMNSLKRSYRGIMRRTPSYYEEFDDQHELNKAILSTCLNNEDGAFENVDSAIQVKNLIKIYSQNDEYEIVEAVKENQKTIYDGFFLGYDIAFEAGDSLLFEILIDEDPIGEDLKIYALIKAFREFFISKLNLNSLFDDIETCEWFIECIKSFELFQESFFEDKKYLPGYRPLALFKLNG